MEDMVDAVVLMVVDGEMDGLFSPTNQLKWPPLFKFFFILRDTVNLQRRARRDLLSISPLKKI
jgi:hypothetical protein